MPESRPFNPASPALPLFVSAAGLAVWLQLVGCAETSSDGDAPVTDGAASAGSEAAEATATEPGNAATPDQTVTEPGEPQLTTASGAAPPEPVVPVGTYSFAEAGRSLTINADGTVAYASERPVFAVTGTWRRPNDGEIWIVRDNEPPVLAEIQESGNSLTILMGGRPVSFTRASSDASTGAVESSASDATDAAVGLFENAQMGGGVRLATDGSVEFVGRESDGVPTTWDRAPASDLIVMVPPEGPMRFELAESGESLLWHPVGGQTAEFARVGAGSTPSEEPDS